nr:ribonuclease H-like domain-containing protein [Tanacetum cinerariifolium]
EPSYNQNCDDNYYPHESPSYPCCDYCGGSHETFQCQPDNQNVDFSGSGQIQTPQYLDVNPPSPEIKYDQSTRTDRPIFLNDDEGHSVNEIVDLEPETTTNTELLGTKDIHPLAIASQSNGSQIKFEDINQIDEDDMEEMDIKWNMALLSMRADKFWKRTGKKISIQGSDVAGFDKSKVECFNCHKMGHFARECRAPRSQEKGRKERACPHHGFFELHQLDTFYNALNVNDKDSLNSATGGDFLDKMPRECLKIIKSKSKVRQSRAKAVVAKVGTSSSTPVISFDVAGLKNIVKALLLD